MRVSLYAVVLAATSTVAAADSFNWIIDSTTSSMTTTISATVGVTLSDTKTTKVAGFVAGDLALPAYSFGSVHITSSDMSYTTNPTFNLTQFLLGGVTITTNGLGFAIPGPNNLGYASPTPASVDLAGAFSQTGNGAEGRGTMTYTGVGVLGSSVGTGTINLLDQSPLPMDFIGTITQSGSQLTMTLPVQLDQTTTQNGIPVRVQINGTVFAKGATTAGGWKVDAGGAWSTASNWSSNAAPQLPGTFDTAVFGPVITQPRTISIAPSTDLPIKRVIVDSSVAYQFAGGIALTGSNATLDIRSGVGHELQRLVNSGSGRIVVADGAAIRVTTITGDGSISKSGAGRVEVDAGSTGPMTIEAGTVATSTNLRVQNSLSISSGARLDVRDARFQLDYDANPSAARDAVRALLVRGRSGGTWNGDGITSTLIAAGAGLALGYGDSEELAIHTWGGAVASTAVLVRLTHLGDTNLDGSVDFADLLRVSQQYGGSGLWVDGDFNYDGLVNFDDLLGLTQNYGSSLTAEQAARLPDAMAADFALAQTLAPEPMMLLALPLTVIRRRRV